MDRATFYSDSDNSCFRDGSPIETNKTGNNRIKKLTIINSNARSLCPKIQSLIDVFDESLASIAIISETWLRDGEDLEDVKDDLREGAGIEMLCRNRGLNHRGQAHGGIAILFRKDAVNLKEIKVGFDENFEVLCAIGNLGGISRKIVVIACYVPPNYSAKRGKDFLDYLTDLVLQIKRKYTDPYIVVSGDFNQWDVEAALADYPDLGETCVGNKRQPSDRSDFLQLRKSGHGSGTPPPARDRGFGQKERPLGHLRPS